MYLKQAGIQLQQKSDKMRCQSAIDKKRQTFISSIRKHQLQSFFQTHREQMLKTHLSTSVQHILKEKLKTRHQQINYLEQMRNKLENRPVASWGEIVEQLTNALRFFNGVFTDWLEVRVIQVLLEIFTREHARTGVQGKVARLLANMVSFSNSSQQEVNTNSYLLDSSVSSDILLLLKLHSHPLEEQLDFAILLGHFCQLSAIARDTVVQLGTGQALTQLGQEFLDRHNVRQQEWLLYLGCCELMSKVFRYDGQNKHLNIDTGVKLIPILARIIEYPPQQHVLKSALICLNNILRQDGQQLYNKLMVQFPHFYHFFFRMLKDQPSRLKEKVLNIFNNLSIGFNQSNIQFQQFSLHDMLDQIFEGCMGTDNIKYIGINLLTNLLTSPSSAQKLSNHRIFPKIISYLRHQHHHIRQESYHCLVTVLQHLPSEEIGILLQHFKILPVAIHQLTQINYSNITIEEYIITMLKIYVQANSKQNSSFNQAVDLLENKYGLGQILMDIYNSTALCAFSSCKLSEQAGQLIDIMAECTSNQPL